MGQHSFYKDVRDRAKAEGKSLLAFSYRGRTFDFDGETPADNEFADKVAMFMIKIMETQDVSKVPILD